MARIFPYRPMTVDPKRLHALHGYSLLDPVHQPALARATRILVTTLETEMSFVGVIGHQRVTLTATQGVPPFETTSQPGLCITTLTGDAVRVIPDTLQDPVAAGHPMVSGAPHIRFYAGIPLTTGDGFNLGTLCVADTRPRDPDARLTTVMQDVAALLIRDLESGVARDMEEEVYRLTRMLHALPVAHFTCRLDGTILTWSPAAQATFGYEPHQIIGQHVSLLTPDGNRREAANVLSSLAAREHVEWFDAIRLTSAGELIETQDMAYPIVSRDGDTVAVAWVSRDVSEMRRLEALVWEGRERFETIVDAIHDAVVMTDVAGNVEYLNPAAQALTGWTTGDARGSAARDVIDLVHEESLERIEHPVQISLRDDMVVGPSCHAAVVHRDGRTFNIEDVAAPIRHRDGTVIGTVMIFRQRDGQGAGPEMQGYLGNHDELTGLPNRHELENQLERALVTAARDNVEHVLILLQVPQYSAVQLRQGQVAANELLKQVAVLLRTRIREVDVLARIGDERFAVLLSHCPLAQAHRIAGELQTVISDFTFVWEGRATLVGLRTTLMPVDADIRNAAALLDGSDGAFDLAALRKELHQRDLRALNDLHPDTRSRQDSGKTLNNAFATDRFRLYAQKIAPLTVVDEQDTLFEFLVHLLDDDGRLLSPSVFVGAAARDHLAVELDRWVVHSALANLSEQAISPLSAWMINVSLPSMEDVAFTSYVREQLNLTGVPPLAVCFELSESIAIANLSTTMRFIADIRELGCKVSISQFGTSLHTFAYLRNLDVDYIKIDGSVIRDIADDSVDRAVVGAVGHIAHVMGIRTVAEHVEDITVLECLKDLGIDYAQGYAIAKPLPLTIVS